VCVCEVISPTY